MAKKAPTMTSTVRTCDWRSGFARSGFTLLEIVIVLVMVSIIFGGAIGMMVFSSDEYAVKKAARETEGMAKRARATAVLKQIPYALEFTPGMVRLMPWSEAIGDEDLEDLGEEDDPDDETAANEPVRWELSLDNGMQSKLRRWDSDQWVHIKGDERQLWRFDPDGLCEPIGLELWLEGGRMVMEFNPLSGAISESQYVSQ